MDNLLNVHQINVLTVIANESYKGFVKALLKETADPLSARPKAANEDYYYFQGKSTLTSAYNEQLEELEATRLGLVKEINNKMADKHKQFLLSFKSLQPNWSLLDAGDVSHLPAVQCKLPP